MENKICQNCKKNLANAIINVNETPQYLCIGCIFGVNKFELELNQPSQILINSDISPCPKCGLTISDIFQQGRLGCAYDYTHFNKEILPLIIKAQKGETQHKGRIPLRPKTVEELKQELKSVIMSENYEEAAKIRDKIKSLQPTKTL